MKIQYCSDLHLEFKENKNYLKKFPIKPEGDILLLAGDIVPFAVMDEHSDFFDFVSDNFELTWWIPGNHEYYYSDASQRSGLLNEKIRNNVSLVNNLSVIHNDIKFIFSTLWSNISPINMWTIQRSMSDFHVIKFKGETFNPNHFNYLHFESLEFIKKELQNKSNDKTVVVTHHIPTFLNYPIKYKGDALNEAFAVELFDLIESSYIDYWIYGHHHNNTPDFNINKTVMLTNQLGYVGRGEHRLFSNKIIET